jgi:hypothetical protein
MFANMEAIEIYALKDRFEDGSLMQIVIWRVPEPIIGSAHPFKYRLFFGKPGIGIIGYDNERWKGDHRYLLDQELPYEFTGVSTLLRDFLSDVAEWRARQ